MADEWEDITPQSAAPAPANAAGAGADDEWEDVTPASPVQQNIRGQAQEQLNQSFGDKALQAVSAVGEFVDRYTGAPTRTYLMARAQGEPEGEAFSRAKSQFGEPAAGAPTGKDIAKEIGLSDQPIIGKDTSVSAGGILGTSFADIQEAKSPDASGVPVKTGGNLGEISPAGALGFAIDIAADPTLLIPGAAIGKAAKKLVPLERLATKLDDIAKTKAVRALAPAKGDIDRLVQKAVGSAAKKKLDDIGKTVLEYGIVGPVPKSYIGLADKAVAQADEVGKKLGSMIDEIANAADDIGEKTALAVPGSKVKKPIAGVNRKSIIERLRANLLEQGDLPGVASQNNEFDSLISEFAAGDDVIGIKKAQELKERVGKQIKWRRNTAVSDIPPKEQFYRELYSSLRQGIEDGAEALAAQLGPEYKDLFVKTKQDYANLKNAAKYANQKAGREFANRYISLSDYQSGQLGGALGAASAIARGESPTRVFTDAVVGATVGALGNKGARRFANQVQAVGAKKLSKILSGVEVESKAARASTGVKAARAYSTQKEERKKALKEQ